MLSLKRGCCPDKSYAVTKAKRYGFSPHLNYRNKLYRRHDSRLRTHWKADAESCDSMVLRSHSSLKPYNMVSDFSRRSYLMIHPLPRLDQTSDSNYSFAP